MSHGKLLMRIERFSTAIYILPIAMVLILIAGGKTFINLNVIVL